MNLSDEITILTGLRVAGIKSNTPGVSYGGTYHPATRDAEGKILVSARCVINAYINRKGRRDQATGKLIDGRRDVIQLTGWNGRQTPDGKGLADLMAKCLSEGKEFSCQATLHNYLGKVFDNQQPVMKQDGTGQLMTRRIGYTIKSGTLLFGDDADKILGREIGLYTGMAGFDSRPAMWKSPDPNHADRVAWKTISAWRMAQHHIVGNPTYGYAIIATPYVAGAPAGQAGPVLDHAGVKAAVSTVQLPVGSIDPSTVVVQDQAAAAGEPEVF